MGAELLQKVNRDTLKFAMKASAANVSGIWRDVYKDPVTDQGKASKRGRLAVVSVPNGEVKTVREEDLGKRENSLEVIYRNGKLLQSCTLEDVRQRAQGHI